MTIRSFDLNSSSFQVVFHWQVPETLPPSGGFNNFSLGTCSLFWVLRSVITHSLCGLNLCWCCLLKVWRRKRPLWPPVSDYGAICPLCHEIKGSSVWCLWSWLDCGLYMRKILKFILKIIFQQVKPIVTIWVVFQNFFSGCFENFINRRAHGDITMEQKTLQCI